MKFRQYYRPDDSSWTYLCAILFPELVYLLLLSIAASIMGKETVSEEMLTSSKALTYISLFLGQLVFMGIFFLYSRIRKINPINACKIKFKFNIWQFLICIGIGVVLILGFSQMINLLDLGIYKMSGINPSGLSINLSNFGMFIVGVLFYALIPAVVEEFLFRGVIFVGLKNKYGAIFSVIVGALLFALVHLSIYQFVYQFVLGVVLCLVVYFTGSIFYSMVVHFVNNFVIILWTYISTVQGNITTLDTFWPAWKIIVSVVAMIVAVTVIVLAFVFWYKKKQPEWEMPVEQGKKVKNMNESKLSDYEKRALSPARMTDTGWVWIAIVAGIGMWIYSLIVSLG